MNLRVLAHNLAWKGFAVAAAAVLYLILIARPALDTSISAPVKYQNMPDALEMGAEAPERVYLEVRGPAARLRNFDPTSVAVVFDLAGVLKPGEFTFTVEANRVDLPLGLKLVRAIPSQVRLRFERQVEAEVPVRARFAEPPPHGYRVRRAVSVPARLRIAGPESRVRRIDHVETDPVSLASVVGRAQFRVHAFVADGQVRFVSKPEVQVEVSVEKAISGGGSNE